MDKFLGRKRLEIDRWLLPPTPFPPLMTLAIAAKLEAGINGGGGGGPPPPDVLLLLLEDDEEDSELLEE